MSEVTQILSKIESGDQQASEELLPLVYAELRKLAAARMASERPDHTLQATALVHEAYVRLVDVEQRRRWDSQGHFFSAAAEAMRRILVEHARSRGRLKRGAGLIKVGISDSDPSVGQNDELVLQVNDALELVAAQDSQAAEFIKLRYFAGLSVAETAAALGVSAPTARARWAYAKALMGRLLDAETR